MPKLIYSKQFKKGLRDYQGEYTPEELKKELDNSFKPLCRACDLAGKKEHAVHDVQGFHLCNKHYEEFREISKREQGQATKENSGTKT